MNDELHQGMTSRPENRELSSNDVIQKQEQWEVPDQQSSQEGKHWAYEMGEEKEAEGSSIPTPDQLPKSLKKKRESSNSQKVSIRRHDILGKINHSSFEGMESTEHWNGKR